MAAEKTWICTCVCVPVPEGSPLSLSLLCVFPSKKRKETLGGMGEKTIEFCVSVR